MMSAKVETQGSSALALRHTICDTRPISSFSAPQLFFCKMGKVLVPTSRVVVKIELIDVKHFYILQNVRHTVTE